VYPDAVMQAIRGRFAAQIVRSDDQGLMPGPAKVFQNTEH
jgi:hypothetical protein